MAVKRVRLRESWVYGRAGLQAGTADTVESLNLQGTYREKILTLGDAFKNFKSLRSLDLSRNLIISLQGIEYLYALHSLNLYYNDIDSMEEIERLRPLSCLKTLDLRLNPITRRDADYRLIIIHTLGSLATLDDRSVRDSERKNAKYCFRLKDFNRKEMPEVEIESIEKSDAFTQKTTAKARLDFNMINADFSKINDRDNDHTDYMKRISPSKYQPEEHSSYVQPQSDFEDGIEYRPLPSPTRSSIRSPGPSSRGKEGHRVTFAESTISELFQKKEGLVEHLEREDALTCTEKPMCTSSGTTTSAYSFKNTYLTSTPVRKEVTIGERLREDTGILNNIGHCTESRDYLKTTEESSRDRLLRLSSDLYVTTHLTDPSTSSNSLSALRKGFTDVSKTYTLPSKPTLANTHLSTGKSVNSWRSDRSSGTKYDSLSAPQNGIKRASSLNSLLSPKVSSMYEETHSDDLLRRSELKKRDIPRSSDILSINDVLQQLMDLVDRYWNGSGSLLQNQRFLVPAQDLLSQLKSAKQMSAVNSATNHGQEDDSETTDSIKLKLIKVMEENHFLRTKVYKLENQAARREGSGGVSLSQDDLRQKYEHLSLQVESLQQQLGKTSKLQETVNLLHNSQRSLVSTNDYLLQQLNKVSPTAVFKSPPRASLDKTSMDRYIYSEPTSSHSAEHYRTAEKLSLCPL